MLATVPAEGVITPFPFFLIQQMKDTTVLGYGIVMVLGAMLGWSLALFMVHRQVRALKQNVASLLRSYVLRGSDWCSVPVKELERVLGVDMGASNGT